MTSCVWILLLASLVGTRAQEFDLSDAFDGDPKPTPKPAPKPPKTGGDGELDLSDAFGPDLPSEPKKPAVNPGKSGGNGDFNILDAFDDGKKPVPPKSGGGGGGGGEGISDSDLEDVAGSDGYKPDAGRGGRGGGRASDYDSTGGQADQPQATQSGPLAGIISAVGVALLGAASSYFAYQKKKLCFKMQGGADPESGRNQSGTHSDPQVMSNLLKS